MPHFIIEREIAGVGSLSTETLDDIAKKTRKVVNDPMTNVRWLYSFVTDNKTYCVYLAPDEEVLRQSSERAGLPISHVSRLTSVLDSAVEKLSK
ncbi:MAG: DUF4242 domain-containing protein [Candidatus Competibacteraceae bacterium]|nr:DUF4242 domain-containing protein [Candidatus Competibacteraceae bacterium]